mgnify:CR=1 FL=1
MLSYTELSESQQAEARELALSGLLTDVVVGAIRFDDAKNGDTLQARIDAAGAKAEEMRTPWFAHEYIFDACRAELEALALPLAQDALYSGPDEHIVAGIVV